MRAGAVKGRIVGKLACSWLQGYEGAQHPHSVAHALTDLCEWRHACARFDRLLTTQNAADDETAPG